MQRRRGIGRQRYQSLGSLGLASAAQDFTLAVQTHNGVRSCQVPDKLLDIRFLQIGQRHRLEAARRDTRDEADVGSDVNAGLAASPTAQ